MIHRSTVFRDCFVRCLEISYQTHRILPFVSVADWKDWAEQEALSPAAILFFLDSVSSSAEIDLQILGSAVASAPVIVMSDRENVEWVLRVIKEGARGYIPTSLPFNLAIEAVRFVLAGGTFVPVSSFSSDVSKHAASAATDGVFTHRQTMVAEALCKGMANKQIAYQLGMSEHTVKVHLRHIMRRLNVRNRTAAAMRARSFLEKKHRLDGPESVSDASAECSKLE